MARNENVGRHGSTESSASWRSVRSNDTVRPFGRASRGTPVTVQTPKDHNNHQYVASRTLWCICLVAHWTTSLGGGRAARAVRLESCAEARSALYVVVSQSSDEACPPMTHNAAAPAADSQTMFLPSSRSAVQDDVKRGPRQCASLASTPVSPREMHPLPVLESANVAV